MTPPNVPEAYLQLRREQIINAAVQCFSQKGFHQTTMQDICRTAELSPGAVYNYFKSKEDIVAACAEMSLQRNEQMFEMASQAQDAVSVFRDVAGAVFSLAKQEGISDAMKFDLELWAESTRNERVARILEKNEEALRAQITDFARRAQNEGVFKQELDPAVIAQVLFSLFLGLEVQLASRADVDVDAYAAVCNAIVDGTFSKGAGNQESTGEQEAS